MIGNTITFERPSEHVQDAQKTIEAVVLDKVNLGSIIQVDRQHQTIVNGDVYLARDRQNNAYLVSPNEILKIKI